MGNRGLEHRVPLFFAALAVLREAGKLRDGSGLIFLSPMRPGQPLSDMTLTKVLRATGLAERVTVQGFRRPFRDWAVEYTSALHAVMELSLAHRVGSAVKQAYARSDLFDQRQELMNSWADFVTGGAKKVGQILTWTSSVWTCSGSTYRNRDGVSLTPRICQPTWGMGR